MAELISLGGMKMSSFPMACFGGFGADKAVAVAVQIEAASGQVVARSGPADGENDPGKAPVFAVQLKELAADGKPGQLLEQKTALTPAAQAEFAD